MSVRLWIKSGRKGMRYPNYFLKCLVLANSLCYIIEMAIYGENPYHDKEEIVK